MLIVSSIQSTNAVVVRHMVFKVSQMRLKDEPQENVNTFAAKITNCCRQISGSGQAPPDLSLVVAGTFIKCTVSVFERYAETIYNTAVIDMICETYITICKKMTGHFQVLHDAGEWAPMNAASKAEDPLQQLAGFVKRLEQRIPGNNSDKPSAGSGVCKCFRCGSLDHMIRDCTKSNNDGGGGSNSGGSNGSDHTRPKRGESHEVTLPDGSKKIWCGRCSRNRGKWTTGPTAHKTTNHVKGWQPDQTTDTSDCLPLQQQVPTTTTTLAHPKLQLGIWHPPLRLPDLPLLAIPGFTVPVMTKAPPVRTTLCRQKVVADGKLLVTIERLYYFFKCILFVVFNSS